LQLQGSTVVSTPAISTWHDMGFAVSACMVHSGTA
jgi:hypothetical protein